MARLVVLLSVLFVTVASAQDEPCDCSKDPAERSMLWWFFDNISTDAKGERDLPVIPGELPRRPCESCNHVNRKKRGVGILNLHHCPPEFTLVNGWCIPRVLRPKRTLPDLCDPGYTLRTSSSGVPFCASLLVTEDIYFPNNDQLPTQTQLQPTDSETEYSPKCPEGLTEVNSGCIQLVPRGNEKLNKREKRRAVNTNVRYNMKCANGYHRMFGRCLSTRRLRL